MESERLPFNHSELFSSSAKSIHTYKMLETVNSPLNLYLIQGKLEHTFVSK